MFVFCVQIRKQQKDHAELIEDYRTKQQQQRALQQQPAAPPMMPAGMPPLLSQPMVSIQPRPGGPVPARLPNASPLWTPGVGGPGGVGQRMPPHLPPQMPPALPNAPQAPQHTQTPPAMVPSVAAPTPGFIAGPRGPTRGSNGAAADGAAPPHQVTHLKSARTFTPVKFSTDFSLMTSHCDLVKSFFSVLYLKLLCGVY